ncbi:MAG: Plug domain-containing protein, partial [Prevotella sp.]|nr:Plug domain-containing protein [Prevotella sp.]
MMRLKIFMIALTSTTNLSAQNDADTAIVFNRELEGVTVVAHNEIRKLREAAMPITVLGTRQLEGTATNINDALARTAGITVRNTGGVGSASRISVRGLEGKRMGVYIDDMAIGPLSDYLSLNDVPTDMS